LKFLYHPRQTQIEKRHVNSKPLVPRCFRGSFQIMPRSHEFPKRGTNGLSLLQDSVDFATKWLRQGEVVASQQRRLTWLATVEPGFAGFNALQSRPRRSI